MELQRALRVPSAGCVAFAGSGGKTAAMFTLARELACSGAVIVTATTHLHVNQVRLADSHWTARQPNDLNTFEESLQGVILVTGPVEGERTNGINSDTLHWLHAVSSYHNIPLLVEADGSRQRPLKAPAAHEPVIPEFADTVVVVAGLSGLGKPLTEEWVHRPEIFNKLAGLDSGEPVSTEALARVLLHPQGGLKNIPQNARWIALLNQADTPVLQADGRNLANLLLKSYDQVVISTVVGLKVGKFERSQLYTDEPSNIQPFKPIIPLAAHERVAGIVLAAGEAKRFGQPKQLLEWRGKSLVRRAAEAAFEAGLSPVIVVTGAYAEQVQQALQELPVEIVHNPEWQSGQASSLKEGLEALTPPPLSHEERGTKSVIFLLADQPGITPELLRSLVETHAATLCPILAPLVDGQRANPLLFDQVTFPDLLALSGDTGGRGIFPKHRLEYLPWHEPLLLLDIDTPEDWERFQEANT